MSDLPVQGISVGCGSHSWGIKLHNLFPISFPLILLSQLLSQLASLPVSTVEKPTIDILFKSQLETMIVIHQLPLRDKNVIRAKDVKLVWLLFIFPWLVSFKYLSYVRDWYLYLNDPSSVPPSAPWWGSFTVQLMKHRPKIPPHFQISAWLLRWNMQTFDWLSYSPKWDFIKSKDLLVFK